ncbi:MAG: sarcosine oxidase [Woeseia sp.]
MALTQTGCEPVPTRYICRSQLYRRHLDSNARFEEFAGAAVVANYADPRDESLQAARLALADLSTLPRTGFKGAGAPAWLENRQAKVPQLSNEACRQDDGSLVARLSNEELLILGDLTSAATLATILQDEWSVDTTNRVYPLPRGDSHCWLALTGEQASETLAKICGVDLRTHKFAELEIAQTTVAQVSAVIVRADLGTTPCFFILCDVSATEYLWDAILDAMSEFDGTPVGIMALRSMDPNQQSPQAGFDKEEK